MDKSARETRKGTTNISSSVGGGQATVLFGRLAHAASSTCSVLGMVQSQDQQSKVKQIYSNTWQVFAEVKQETENQACDPVRN